MLAPVYDLVCTRLYEELDNQFAMPVGQARTMAELNADALQQFQIETGINLKRQAKILCRFIEQVQSTLISENHIVKEQTWPENHSVLDQIVQLCYQHAEHLKHWLSA